MVHIQKFVAMQKTKQKKGNKNLQVYRRTSYNSTRERTWILSSREIEDILNDANIRVIKAQRLNGMDK